MLSSFGIPDHISPSVLFLLRYFGGSTQSPNTLRNGYECYLTRRRREAEHTLVRHNPETGCKAKKRLNVKMLNTFTNWAYYSRLEMDVSFWKDLNRFFKMQGHRFNRKIVLRTYFQQGTLHHRGSYSSIEIHYFHNVHKFFWCKSDIF